MSSSKKEITVKQTRKRKATSQGKQVVGLIQQVFVFYTRQYPKANPSALHHWASSSQCSKAHWQVVAAGNCSSPCPSGGKPQSGIKYITAQAMGTHAIELLSTLPSEVTSVAESYINSLVSYKHTHSCCVPCLGTSYQCQDSLSLPEAITD